MQHVMKQVPPNNLEAEQSLIGSILLNNEAYYEVADSITSSMFYRDSHKDIYDAVCNLVSRKEPADIITLTNELKNNNKLDTVGGAYYITQLIGSVPTHHNAKHYAKVVQDKYIGRELIRISSQIMNECLEGGDEQEVLITYQSQLNDLGRIKAKKDLIPIREVLNAVMDNFEDRANNGGEIGLNTGFVSLDKFFALRPGELTIIAARPGMGKTAFLLNILSNLAKQSICSAVFSLEMAKELLAERILSAESNISADSLKSANLRDHEWRQLTKAIGTISDMGIEIDDTPAQTIMQMKSKSLRLMRDKPLGIVGIDYLGLVKSPSSLKSDRYESVSENVRQSKELARELNIHVIELCQLSRDVEKRADKRPQLSDLRESGEIEQSADNVLFIYRDAYYTNSADPTTEIIVAKQRNGKTGYTLLDWDGSRTKFSNKQEKPFYAKS